MSDSSAVSSVRMLEQRWHARDRSLLVTPSGHSMKAPAPPSQTTQSTDSSVGCRARHLSAEVSCCGALIDRLKLTSGHAATSHGRGGGGALSGSGGSIGGLSRRPARPRT